jgi:hypothetical protein
VKRICVWASLGIFVLACGGSTQHPPVQEVPIDQGNAHSGDLPPDEVDASVTTSSVALPDSGPPLGVGPQSLDAPADAGAAHPQVTVTPFVQRHGGLTQHECTDVIMTLAKLMTKENGVPTPSQADLAVHPVFGQMLNECGTTTTKKQQKCAVAAKTSAAWKKCME